MFKFGHCRLMLFAAASMVAVLSGTARADWPVDTRSICDDPLIIRQQAFFLEWFPRPGAVRLVRLIGAPQEFYTVEVNQKFITDGSIRIGAPFTNARVEMDAGRLAILRPLVAKRSSDSDLPFYITDEMKLAGYILTSGETKVIGSIFKFMFDRESARHARISTLELFLALGGEMIQTGQIEKTKAGDYLAIETIRYRVSVGQETRSFLVYTCAYPAVIAFHGARTVGGPNPKIFKPVDDKKWGMFNADSGNKERDYDFVSTDDDWVILRDGGAIPEEMKSQMRVSRKGGPVERLSGGAWSQLYAKTEAL